MYINKKIIYAIEDAEWSIAWDGRYITSNINKSYKPKSAIFNIGNLRILPRFKNKIIHFGSRSTFLPDNYRLVNKSNKVVFTWFHGTENDREYIDALPLGSKNTDIIHTSCTITKRQLIDWGAEEEKIVVIPLGVDLNIFKPAGEDEKEMLREKIGVPAGAVCVGSFQKDGEGWEEGNEPKLIKGPDIFCDVLEKIKKKYPLFIILTGPARGYVKNRLKEMGIPFKHFYLDNYLDIPKYFKILDSYIISSRAEGGPKAVLECFASGIPYVTTRVGMVPDIVSDGVDSLVSEAEDVEGLSRDLSNIIEDRNLRDKLVQNGLSKVKSFDWSKITTQYFEKIYSKLL